MTDQERFIAAEQVLTGVIDQIKDDQWEMPVTQITDRAGSLRELINYHAYDDAWVPDVLAGKTIDVVGNRYDGDLLGENPKAAWHQIVDKAVAAVKALDDVNKTVHLSYGDFPAREYLWHITSFRSFRTVDIARLIGVDDSLPEDLAQSLWDMLKPNIEEWRQMGVFPPEVSVPADASIQDKLLGMAGRQPSKQD